MALAQANSAALGMSLGWGSQVHNCRDCELHPECGGAIRRFRVGERPAVPTFYRTTGAVQVGKRGPRRGLEQSSSEDRRVDMDSKVLA